MLAAADSRDERRAERASSALSGHRSPDRNDLATGGGERPAAVMPSVAARIEGLSGGSAPSHDLSESLGPRFDFDFSRIRIHADGEAARLNRSLGARAFTYGSRIVFGEGEYAPHTPDGSRLLAHELSHVAQQSSRHTPILQLTALQDYADSDPLHDPSRLTDAEIEATDEYAAYMAMPIQIPMRAVTADEARLACRLYLRAMREISPYVVNPDLAYWLGLARARLDTQATAEGSVGQMNWVQVTAGDIQTPAGSASDFVRWMLAAGTQPDPATGNLNCWELVLFSAFRAGYLSETRMRGIYTAARTAMTTSGDAMQFPRTLEASLRSSQENIYDPANPSTPRPLPGDLVIFDEAANHVALATGRMVGGQVEIISHWPPPDGDHHVKRTTIEALLPQTGVTVAKFWSPIWG